MRRRIGRWRSAALELAAAGLVAATLALPGARGALAAGVVGDGTPGSCTEAALAAAASGGGLVTFNCGPAPVTITLSAPLDISAPETTIDGGGQVTLRGGGGRIIRHRTYGLIGSSVLTLTNLTITGGRATGAGREANGGAIQSVFEAARPEYRPTLNVINVTFLDNDATLTSFSSGDSYDYGGGAIFTQGGTLNVVNSTFSGNDAANAAGGAIHGLQSSISIENSTFTDNSAIGNAPENSQGGAIYVDGLNAPVGGARAQGGAIGGGSTANGEGTGNAAIMITRSLFAGNSATKSGTPQDGSGGALSFPQRAVLTIENSTFVGNTAFGTSYNANGGALYIVNQATPFQITNSTFANNHAGWVGGAIRSAQIGEAPGGAVRNTLFSNNTADNGPNHWKIQQHCSSELTDTGGYWKFPPGEQGRHPPRGDHRAAARAAFEFSQRQPKVARRTLCDLPQEPCGLCLLQPQAAAHLRLRQRRRHRSLRATAHRAGRCNPLAVFQRLAAFGERLHRFCQLRHARPWMPGQHPRRTRLH